MLKLTLFVVSAATNSQRPGEMQNMLRVALPPKSDRVDDENVDAFPAPDKKNATVEFYGLSDELQAAFKAGQRVTLTLEVQK